MEAEAISVRVESPAKQSATFKHMGDAVCRCLVKLHGRGQFRKSGFSAGLPTDEFQDVDGAVEHLHLVRSFLRAFLGTLHHAKLTIALILQDCLRSIPQCGTRILLSSNDGSRTLDSSNTPCGECPLCL